MNHRPKREAAQWCCDPSKREAPSSATTVLPRAPKAEHGPAARLAPSPCQGHRERCHVAVREETLPGGNERPRCALLPRQRQDFLPPRCDQSQRQHLHRSHRLSDEPRRGPHQRTYDLRGARPRRSGLKSLQRGPWRYLEHQPGGQEGALEKEPRGPSSLGRDRSAMCCHFERLNADARRVRGAPRADHQ